MRVLVTTLTSWSSTGRSSRSSSTSCCKRSDFVLPLAVATEETENLIGAAAAAADAAATHSWSISRAATSSTRRRSRPPSTSGASPAPPWTSAARPTRCPRPLLAARPDVVATPHMGGLTTEAIEGQALETVAQVAEILAGRAPAGSVNAEHASRLERQR